MAPRASEFNSFELLKALPAAVYTTDATGRITFYNDAAAALWGFRPELGKSEWCGSWRLYWPDGRPMPHDQCPMATALKEGRPIRGAEAVTERPDGTRIPFLAYLTPLRDASGTLIGAVNTLLDITDRKLAEEAAGRLAVIVQSSADAIISEDLNGVITSWNSGATRVFGYSEEEIVGKPVALLGPTAQHDEETSILARLRRGERVDHYETITGTRTAAWSRFPCRCRPSRTLRAKSSVRQKSHGMFTHRRTAEEISAPAGGDRRSLPTTLL